MQGVYAIVNTLNGRRYIGSSTDVSRRLRIHRWNLERGTHENGYLLRAYTKYGASAFMMILVEEVFSPEDLLAVEQRHIEATADRYNVCAVAGKPPSPKGRAIPEKLLAYSRSPKSAETKARISAGLKGHVVSAETRARQSAAKKGKPVNDALRAQQIQSKRRALSPEHRAKISAANMGRRVSEETRAKQSAAQRTAHLANPHGPRGQKSVEHRARLSAALKAFWETKRASELAVH